MKNDEKQFQSFRLRVHACWEHFLQGEEQLRQLIDQKADSEAIAERIASLLTPAFNDVSAEVGFNGEKHELILNLDGNWARVFPLIYFQKQAPAKVLEHWNILIGRQSREIDRQKEKALAITRFRYPEIPSALMRFRSGLCGKMKRRTFPFIVKSSRHSFRKKNPKLTGLPMSCWITQSASLLK